MQYICFVWMHFESSYVVDVSRPLLIDDCPGLVLPNILGNIVVTK